jgi:hypothetical protein
MKKDFELYWLERARDLRPDLFAGTVVSMEAPDFVLVNEPSRHGVELTRFVHDLRPNLPIGEEQTGLRRKVMELAKKDFSMRSQTKLRVGAVFHGSIPLRRTRVPELAKAIAGYFAERLSGDSAWAQATWDGDDDESIPRELLKAFATVVPSVSNTHWYPAQAGWVSHADYDEINRIVAAKEKNVVRYRTRCDELSLVIVFEGTPHSARAIHAPMGPVSFSILTRFDRVLCLDVLEKRLVDLPLQSQVA